MQPKGTDTQMLCSHMRTHMCLVAAGGTAQSPCPVQDITVSSPESGISKGAICSPTQGP